MDKNLVKLAFRLGFEQASVDGLASKQAEIKPLSEATGTNGVSLVSDLIGKPAQPVPAADNHSRTAPGLHMNPTALDKVLAFIKNHPVGVAATGAGTAGAIATTLALSLRNRKKKKDKPEENQDGEPVKDASVKQAGLGNLFRAMGRGMARHKVLTGLGFGTLGIGGGAYGVSKFLGNEGKDDNQGLLDTASKWVDDTFVSGRNKERNRWIAGLGGVGGLALLAALIHSRRKNRLFFCSVVLT